MRAKKKKLLIMPFVLVLVVIAVYILYQLRNDAKSTAFAVSSQKESTASTIPVSSKTAGSLQNLVAPDKVELHRSGDEWQYPGSDFISAGSSQAVFKSNDPVGPVTDWYKNKIRNMGFSYTNFSQSQTNGSTLNIINGKSPGFQIAVEISKDGDFPISKIVIRY